VFCNNCGFANPVEESVCASCGYYLYAEPHISDIASGSVLSCEVCGALNLEDSSYCRICGKVLKNVVVPKVPAAAAVRSAYHGEMPSAPAYQAVSPQETAAGESLSGESRHEAAQIVQFTPQINARHESLLEKLDRMERELETQQKEVISEPEKTEPDTLDAHEEALNNIAYTLDSLIADLLEAEVREYAFPDFIHPDETGFPLKDAVHPVLPPEEKKGRDLQELLVVLALIAAIFLVGLSFGLWGSYFFGL
jgi:hypothetical protein